MKNSLLELAKKAYEEKYDLIVGMSISAEAFLTLPIAYYTYRLVQDIDKGSSFKDFIGTRNGTYLAMSIVAHGTARLITTLCSRKATLEDITDKYELVPKQKQKEFDFKE